VPDAAAAEAVVRNQDLIQDELNVKSVELMRGDAQLISWRVRPNLPVLGKRVGGLMPAIRRALVTAPAAEIAAAVARGEPITLEVEGARRVVLEADALLVDTVSAEGFACAESEGYLIGLDTRLDDELILEGLARELVRTVQEARKQAGLHVSDRITLYIEGDELIERALATHREYIMAETLTREWKRPPKAGAFVSEHALENSRWTVSLRR
jgi:isoleucyl-tRNA synthetase